MEIFRLKNEISADEAQIAHAVAEGLEGYDADTFNKKK